MLQQLEKYRVPEDFTGSRLLTCCNRIIETWTALQLAFEHQTLTINESPENIKKMLSYQLAAYIYNCETEISDIVEFLSIYLEKYMQLVIEDSSDKYIAGRLLHVFSELEQGREQEYLKLLEDIKVYEAENKKLKHVANIEDDDSSSEEEEAPQLVQQQQQQPIEMEDDVDSDGFETVQPKRRYKK